MYRRLKTATVVYKKLFMLRWLFLVIFYQHPAVACPQTPHMFFLSAVFLKSGRDARARVKLNFLYTVKALSLSNPAKLQKTV